MENEIQQIFITNGRDWIEIIIEALIPVAIMLFTLYSEKNRHRESLEQQAKEHKEEMQKQKESVRLGVMPIFDVVKIEGTLEPKPTLSGDCKEHHILTIRLKNVGTGVATRPYVKTSSGTGKILDLIDENGCAYYQCYKDCSRENMIASPEKEIDIQILRILKNEDVTEESDIFMFTICFDDVLGNQYEQRIVIEVIQPSNEGDVEIDGIATKVPDLVEN